eukprot:2994391-Rhodomonas_salina.1
MIPWSCETGGLTSFPSRIMTSLHAKIEEYCTHAVVVLRLWYQAEYEICPVVVVHMHAQLEWQGHSLGLPLATRGRPQTMGNDVIDLVFFIAIHHTW